MAETVKIPIVRMNRTRDRAKFESALAARKSLDSRIERNVRKIVEDVRGAGDKALFAYVKKFDGVALGRTNVRLDASMVAKQAALAPPALCGALRKAARRIAAYHRKQGLRAYTLATEDGTLSSVIKPLARVALYVPGGHTIYPSSVLMNAIPARLAGVREIVAVTPVKKDLDPALACAFQMMNIREIYRIGGAQAIAALAYGTKTIRRVDKIVGPGNAYVAAAKKQVFGMVDIDMIAGPSEVVILADDSADPAWVALDLCAQAEHGSGNEMAVLVVENERYAGQVRKSLEREIARSEIRPVFNRLAAYAVCICVCGDRNESIDLVNNLAPEHLQIMTRSAGVDVGKIRNAGAIFLGVNTPVALGDYCIGTNHVLPTGGAARYASPLGVEDFQKRVSVARIGSRGLRAAAPDVSVLARAERFIYHALSVERRVR